MTERTSARHSNWPFRLALGAICLAALALRVAVCLQLCPEEFVGQPATVTDMATYRRIALEIVHGDLPTHFYYQPFYYAVFLPLVYTILGPGPWGPALVQAVLGAATVWLTGLAAAHLFGRRAGLIAALLLALARFQVFYVPFLLLEVLQGFWLSLLVYLAIRFWRRPSLAPLVCLGLTASAATLTRGNAILLVPGIVALVSWRLRRRPARAAAAVGLCVVLVYAPQLPFALRNLRHFGRWTGPSSAQDAVLALGNNPEAPAGGLEYPATYHDWLELADRPTAERIPVSHQVMSWIRQAPLQYAELKGRMLLLFWHRIEIPNNISIEREGRYSSVLGWPQPFLLDFAVIGTLGLFGLLTAFRWRSPPVLFLYYAVGAFCAATVLFYVLARFRVPGVPLLSVFAGAGCAKAWRFVQRHAVRSPDYRQARLLRLLGVAVSALLVLDGFSWYQRALEVRVVRLLRPRGVHVQTHRRTLVYDHGPFALGGMATVPVTSDGLVVTKRFALPDGRLPQTVPTLRVPAILRSETRFQASLTLAGRTYGTDSMTVEQDGGRQRLVFRLRDLPENTAPVEAVLHVRLTDGEMAILVDTLRWYGRSRYASPTAELPIQAEAAFELEWLASPSAPIP